MVNSVSLASNSNKLTNSMFIKTFLATCLLAQSLFDCAIKGDAHKTNHLLLNQHQQSLLKTAMQQNPTSHNHSSSARPIDRPSLSLVAAASNDGPQNYKNFSSMAANRPLEEPVDWFIMGGDKDLMTEEGKNSPSIVEFTSGGGRNFTARRSSQKRARPSSGKGASNTTVFDDEQSSDSSDSNEIFDDVEDGSTLSGNQKEPECASNGRYYCTYKEDYPLKLVTEVTKYYKWPLEKLFRDLHAQIMPKLAQDTTGNLVCDSITRVVRPGWTRNTNDRWLVVINTENYHQYVTEVVCQYGSNSRCNFIPPCYYSSCQQRYNTQKLLVIDPSNPYRGPFLSEFLFPSCCVCYVPSAAESYQDKYRSSPATIYQRTMQQEAASNLYPPQYRPPGLMEEPQASVVDPFPNTLKPGTNAALTRKQSTIQSNVQPLGPGEIRREGDQYKKTEQSVIQADSHQRNGYSSNELRDFPRLGISDSLIDQRSTGSGSVSDSRA